MKQTRRGATAFFFFILFSSNALAQELDIAPVLQQSVQDVIANSVTAITVFTSQNAISGGSYNISRGDLPDMTIDVYKFPLSYKFGEEEDKVRYFLSGNIAALFVDEDIDAAGFGEPYDESKFDTYSIAFGGGLDYHFYEGFHLQPFLGFSYSHVKNDYTINNPTSALPPLNDIIKEATNWSADVGTIAPGLKVFYLNEIGKTNLKIASTLAYLYNFDIHTSLDVGSISSGSGVWHNSIVLDIPGGFSVKEWPFRIKPIIGRTDIFGDSRNELPFSHFYEYGIALTFVNPDKKGWLAQIGFGATYVYDRDVDGWRIGIVI